MLLFSMIWERTAILQKSCENKIQTREEKMTLWWRHNITWSSSPNLGFRKWWRLQISPVISTAILRHLLSHLTIINSRLITLHLMMKIYPPEIVVRSPAGHQWAFQPSFSLGIDVMVAILSVRRCGVTASPRFTRSPFVALIHLTLRQILKWRDIKMMDMTIQTTHQSPRMEICQWQALPGLVQPGQPGQPMMPGSSGVMSSMTADAVCLTHTLWIRIRTHNLSDEQVSYIQNDFDEFLPDAVIEQSILSEAPVPELTFLRQGK